MKFKPSRGVKRKLYLRLPALLLLASSFSIAAALDDKKPSFWQRVLRFVGISATPSAQKGPGDEISGGDIWVADLERNILLRLTSDGGYRSPILLRDDRIVLALKGDDLVQIPISGGA